MLQDFANWNKHYPLPTTWHLASITSRVVNGLRRGGETRDLTLALTFIVTTHSSTQISHQTTTLSPLELGTSQAPRDNPVVPLLKCCIAWYSTVLQLDRRLWHCLYILGLPHALWIVDVIVELKYARIRIFYLHDILHLWQTSGNLSQALMF